MASVLVSAAVCAAHLLSVCLLLRTHVPPLPFSFELHHACDPGLHRAHIRKALLSAWTSCRSHPCPFLLSQFHLRMVHASSIVTLAMMSSKGAVWAKGVFSRANVQILQYASRYKLVLTLQMLQNKPCQYMINSLLEMGTS